MQSWVWAIIGLVPVVAVGVAYSMGAFTTETASLNQKIADLQTERTAFEGDSPYLGGRSKKTKKSKSKHKKTKRRG